MHEHRIDSGLDGVTVAETRLSHVDGAGGRLVVRGRDVDRLVTEAGFEDAAAVLWDGLAALPPEGLRRAFGRARVDAFARVPDLVRCARHLTPVAGLRLGLALLPEADGDLPAHVRATAAAGVFIAALAADAAGRAPVAPDPDAGHVADLLRMLEGRPAAPERVAALEGYLVTVADHGMNASTFAARVAASTRAGTIAAVIAGLSALEGPLHGGAPGPVLDMLDAIPAAGAAGRWIAGRLASGERLMGFGHRVYRTRDPRADVLKRLIGGLRHRDDNRIAFAEAVEAAALAALAERHPGRRLDTNVEFYTALLLEAVGVPRASFTACFAQGRILGWVAHAHEQVATGRLVRPASRYVGALPDAAAA